ncbi:MAG: hypothetical protein JWO38_1889 [Gemmataceae bacterium]|nr:hypothetical protein [Gemmataceae bacterium]
MSQRAKRSLVKLAAVLLTFSLAATLEWRCRRQETGATQPVLDGSGAAVSATDLRRKYADPEELAALCRVVQIRNEALADRSFRLRHRRTCRVTEFDRGNRPVAITESVERVHFEGRTERKTTLEVRQVLGEPIGLTEFQGGADPAARWPFSDATPAGLYRYELEGIEEVGGGPVVRVRFEPVRPAEGTFKGSAWVDPGTAEPVRMHGSALRLPVFLDRFEMMVDYGPAETGHNQVRRVTVDVAGGLAFVSKHYRLEAGLSDYEPGGP